MITTEQLNEWQALADATIPKEWWDAADFIDEFKEAVPELIAEVRRLRLAIDEVGGLCKCGHARDTHDYCIMSPGGYTCKLCECLKFEREGQP